MSKSHSSNSPRDHPGRKFYEIVPTEDGTVDVYLRPEVTVYPIEDGRREYDMTVRVVRGIVPWPEIEEDIRARYDAWCKTAEEITI